MAAAAVLAVLVGGIDTSRAASKKVDLDNNGSNESIVDLTIVSSYPAKVKNKITNKAVGKTFSFSWPSAGPGGFTSSLGTGTSAGVGTIWEWQTGQSIYSYTGSICDKDICFTPTNSSVGPRGPFSVPGRSLSRTDVTLSAASLTSSIISFFSPPQVLATTTSRFTPGEGTLEELTNETNEPITIELLGPGGECCDGENQVICDGECVSYLEDENNCGGCAGEGGPGEVCEGEGKTCCDGECVDIRYDQRHCGACFQATHGLSCCAGEAVDISSDVRHCGGCGSACEDGQVCDGGACESEEYGISAPLKPSLFDQSESYDKEGCPFGTIRCGAECVDPSRDERHCGGCDAACDESEVCSASTCFAEAPPCDQPTVVETIPPGETVTICRPSRAVLAREVVGVFRACGDGIPDGEGAFCTNEDPASAGSFNRLVPIEMDPGPAYLSVTAARIEDATGDGLPGEGELSKVWLTLLNVGSSAITGVSAQLMSEPVQLLDDDVDGIPDGPFFGALIGQDTSRFPDFPPLDADGTADCSPLVLDPKTSLQPFDFFLGLDHPGDVARPFSLLVSGMVDGQPWQQEVPFNLGIAGRCDAENPNGNFDGVDGLMPPMERLVPSGDPAVFARPAKRGSVRPLKLYLNCGGYVLKSGDIAPPEIVGLEQVGVGPLDITTLRLDNDTRSSNPFFRSSGPQWHYNLSTKDLAVGSYVMTIRLGEGRDFSAGFVLR